MESTSRTADSTFAVSAITQSALPATGEPQANKLPIPIIAGAAGGGGVALIILALIIYVCVHARRSRMEHRNQLDTRLHDLPASKAKVDSDVKGDSDVQKSATESTRPLSFVTTVPPPIQPQNRHQQAPIPALSPTNTITRKPLSPQSPHLSQLSGSTARRSEQDSPWTSPYPKAAQSPQEIWAPPIQEHHQQNAWQSQTPYNAPATPRNPPEAWTSPTHGTPGQNDPHAWDSVTPQTSPQHNQHAYDHQNAYSPPYNPYEYQEYQMTEEDEQRRTWASSYSQFAPPASPQDESQLSHTHSPPQNPNPHNRNSDTWDSSYSQVPPQQPHHTLGPAYLPQTSQNYPSNATWEPAPSLSPFPAPPAANSNSPQHVPQAATWEPAPHSNPFPAPPQGNTNPPQQVPQTIRVVDEENATAQPGSWPLRGDSGREPLVPQTSTPGNPPPAERAHWI
ncbi:hypothetical protein BCR34DRAFT_601288 [Clohesyomyces aquaticus]|uniref:Uncharacterized protein n=1 Tax=Clohesyomyces aquaticus TaxID=1231657 RepID=A0A1Y1ZMN0_9PLEO|nr:hypothetical protein BCR34DRAFT_601288 [Clohesyomyces aquaticus]